MSTIYLPGLGNVDTNVFRINAAMKEYDERLFLGTHPETGDWVAFMKMEHGQPPYPVLGFGKELPSPDEIQKRLYESDAKRHGDSIRQHINRKNEDLKKAAAWRVADAAENTKEHVEFTLRKVGESPVIKSLRLKPRR